MPRLLLRHKLAITHFFEGPLVLFDELVYDIARVEFTGKNFPGVGFHLDVLALRRILREPIHRAFDVVAGALEAIGRLRVQRNVKVHAPFVTHLIRLILSELKSQRQVTETTQWRGGAVVGDDLVEVDRLVKTTQFFQHVGRGFQLQRGAKVKLADADACTRDSGKGAFWSFILHGQMAGIVVQADEFEEVFVLRIAVVVETEEFQHLAAGFDEAERFRLQAQVQVVPSGNADFLNVLAAETQVFKDGGDLIPADVEGLVGAGQGADAAAGSGWEKLSQDVKKSLRVLQAVIAGPVWLEHALLHPLSMEGAVGEAIDGENVAVVCCQPILELGQLAWGQQFQGGLVTQPQANAIRLATADAIFDPQGVVFQAAPGFLPRVATMDVGAVAEMDAVIEKHGQRVPSVRATSTHGVRAKEYESDFGHVLTTATFGRGRLFCILMTKKAIGSAFYLLTFYPFFAMVISRVLFVSACCLYATVVAGAAEMFDKGNLAAWCIVPFDAQKRGPEARAAMLEKMGVTKLVYDYRAEHIPQWDEELTALKKHGVQLFGWWFPTSMNEEAKQTLALFQRHGVKPQLWINGNGGSLEVASPEEQKERTAKEVARIKPICEAASPLGCQVALYNHGNWYGEPENAIAVVQALKAQGISNIGMVYNLHHGHGHLDRLEKVLPQMLPHLLCLNLNGMDVKGDEHGRKILPLGVGSEDVRILKIISDSGYKGVIGILNHTPEDAEGRLLDNLDGLAWLLPQVAGKPAGEKPKYRTWKEVKQSTAKVDAKPEPVPSLNESFGKALQGGLVLDGGDAYAGLPLSVECRVKLNSAKDFNIIVAHEEKASPTHWELYSYKDSGVFSVYLPGRGGEYRTKVNICDGLWHDLIASIETDTLRLYVDGKQVLEEPLPSLTKDSHGKKKLAFGRLVEGGLRCDGILDDVRISRGPMKPRKGDHPRQRMDNTLALWNFDDLEALLSGANQAPAPVAFQPSREPLRAEEYPHWQTEVNRERVFDYYAKQAVLFMGKALPPLIPGFPGLDGGQQGHWGNQNDAVTWKDGRFAASELGPVLSTVFKGAGLTINKGVCVQLEDGNSAVFDPETLSFPVVWSDGFLKLSDARHGFMGGGMMDGKLVKKTEGAKPTEHRYHGFYRHGEKVIFSYTLDGKEHLVASPNKQEDLSTYIKGGPSQWPKWIETKGELGQGEPFATDRLTIPFENPYGTLFFISGHDFFSDGSAAVSTMTGEVWLVRGIDEGLKKLRWKRYATGLHQPLGVKIVKDKLYVLGRDQITRLHDLNGDDEADFYECVSNAQQTSPGGHDYITGLDMDAEGRFYTASGNQGIIRVTGDKVEVLATGFRNPNGLGLSPDGRFITTSVQEGDWTPASAICQVEIGKNEGAHFGANGPKNNQPPEPPLMYLPRGEDNSSGGQCFIMGSPWKALVGEGNFAHFSPGTGTGWLVMRQQVQGRWQAAAVRIAGGFDSGAQTGRFSPLDGQLYVTGMQGWGSYTPLDGSFQRVRYIGKSTPVPISYEARDNGVLIRFDRPVETVFASKAAHHFAQCWNYNYSAAYGSPEMSARYADTVGHDPLEVRSAQVLDSGRTLFLEIPQLIPASMVHLRVGVTGERAHDVFMTVHALASAFTEYPGYEAIAKTFVPQTKSVTKVNSKANPWAKGEKGREIVVDAALGLQFVQKKLTAKPGERITLLFKNPDVVPHNWLLAKPGSLQKLGDAVNLMITDPQGLAKHYVPDSDDVLVYTDMTLPNETFSIHFDAPKEKGEYPYLCTFPGHWMVMNGVLTVE